MCKICGRQGERKNMKRLYAEEFYTSTSEDAVNRIKWLREKQEGLDEEKALQLQKIVYNAIRLELGTTKLIGALLHKDGNEIGIPVYNVEATGDNAYTHHFDEERQEFYIEVE